MWFLLFHLETFFAFHLPLLGSYYINYFCDSQVRLKWWDFHSHLNLIQKVTITCIFLAVYIALCCVCTLGIHCRITVCFCMSMAKFIPCLSPIVLRGKRAYLEIKSVLSLSQNSLEIAYKINFVIFFCLFIQWGSSAWNYFPERVSLFPSIYILLTNYLAENLLDIFHPQLR